jgi:hypothetical protein
MRADWKSVLPSIIIACLALLNSNCVTMYKIRSPEDIEELTQRFVPMPESLLIIPEFNGKDTIPIFFFETRGGWAPWTAHMIYNDGKLEFLQKERGIFISGYIKVIDIQNFILKLNQMGFFSISNESIEEKKFIEYKGCCLGLFFGGIARETIRTDMATLTI